MIAAIVNRAADERHDLPGAVRYPHSTMPNGSSSDEESKGVRSLGRATQSLADHDQRDAEQEDERADRVDHRVGAVLDLRPDVDRERDFEKFIRSARVKKGRNKGERLAQSSRDVHRTHLTAYYQWLQIEGFEDWYDVRPSDIGDFVVWKESQGSRRANITAAVNSLIRFYDHLGQDYPEKINPARRHADAVSYSGGKTAREEEGYETGMTDDEFQLLLENVPSRHAERDRLVLKFLGLLGLRRSEVAVLKLNHVEMDTQRVDVPGVKSRSRAIKYPSRMKTDIRRWINGGQRDEYQYAYESINLFLSERGANLSTDAIGQIVHKTAQNAGIQEKMYDDAAGRARWRITPHQLRHYFGKSKMREDNNWGLKELSEYMGHSSVQITADRYGQMTDDERFEMFDNVIA